MSKKTQYALRRVALPAFDCGGGGAFGGRIASEHNRMAPNPSLFDHVRFVVFKPNVTIGSCDCDHPSYDVPAAAAAAATFFVDFVAKSSPTNDESAQRKQRSHDDSFVVLLLFPLELRD
jgi:hypothetical protein